VIFIKQIIITISLLMILSGCVDEKPKYIRGDCITPIDHKYSWFGQYAKVEFYSSMDEFSDKNYILLFRNYRSNSVVFSQSIEVKTKKVDKELCELNT